MKVARMPSEKRPKSRASQLAPVQSQDYDKIGHIVASLDFLRREAKLAGDEDIETLVASTFDICMTTYNVILRYELAKKLEARLR